MSEFTSEQLPLKDGILTPPVEGTRRILAAISQDGNKILRSAEQRSGAVPFGFPDVEFVQHQQKMNARDIEPPRRVENPDDGAMAPRKEEKEEARKEMSASERADQVLSVTSPVYIVGKWAWRKLK